MIKYARHLTKSALYISTTKKIIQLLIKNKFSWDSIQIKSIFN